MTYVKFPKSKFTPETDGTNADQDGYLHRLQHGLGPWGLAVIGGGTALILSILGFLLFLWIGESLDGDKQEPAVWRWIMLQQHATQAITLSTVLLRAVVTAQSSIYTSLIAGVILEKHGVPLYRVAEISIIRCINDGPLRLAWLLITSARGSALQASLAVLLLTATIAVQFSSTLLVSDLDLASLVGSPRDRSLRMHMSTEVISLNRKLNNWVGRPTAYVPFGETLASRDWAPNALGVSDTGMLNRVFLPLSTTRMSALRDYEGKGYGFDSRFVCMRPVVSASLSVTIPPPFTDTLPFHLQIVGSVSWESTFARANLSFPRDCENGGCFSTFFNCSLPQFQFQDAQARQGFTNSLCIPDGTRTRSSARNHTISDEPITASSQVFFFFRNNGTHGLWRGPGGRFLSGNFGLRNFTDVEGEWTTYNRAIGGRTPDGERIETGTLRLDMSVCFQQLAFNFANVKLSSERDVDEPQVAWDPDGKRWNTRGVQRQLGVIAGANTSTKRGVFSVDSIQNRQRLDATQYLTNKLVNDLYNSPRITNISLFMDPLGSGISSVKPHVEYQALFADILNATNRPGVALQSTLTTLSGSIVNEAIPQFDVEGNATLTSSVSVLTPRGFRGLAIVLGVVALNMACGLAVVVVFMVQCRHSGQGNYWQGIAQVISDETAWILEGASRSSDGHVKRQLRGGGDSRVHVVESGTSGRARVAALGTVT